METRSTQTIVRQQPLSEFADGPGSIEQAGKRLDVLLAANAEIEREKMRYGGDSERREIELMKRPLDTEKAYSYLGLLLGIFPPAAMFTRYAVSAVNERGEIWILGVLMIMNLLTAVVGFFSGKLIGKMVRLTEARSWSALILLTPLMGILWGMMAGGAGGIIVFVIGAIFGAIFGAMVGMVAIPAFTIFHRLLKRGDMIDMKHFLPLAFGVTFTICSFIIGL